MDWCWIHVHMCVCVSMHLSHQNGPTSFRSRHTPTDTYHQFTNNPFKKGNPWDILTTVVHRAPVARARLTRLRDGGSCLSLAVVCVSPDRCIKCIQTQSYKTQKAHTDGGDMCTYISSKMHTYQPRHVHNKTQKAHTVMDAKSVMKTIELWARETRRMRPLEQTEASQPQDGGSGGGRGSGEDVDTSLGSSSSSSSSWEELEEVLLGPSHLDEIGASFVFVL